MNPFVMHSITVCCCITFSTEPLESPWSASPLRSSRMSMCPSLLMSSCSKSSAQRCSRSSSGPEDSLSWQCTQGNQVRWVPMTGHQSELADKIQGHQFSIHSLTQRYVCLSVNTSNFHLYNKLFS